MIQKKKFSEAIKTNVEVLEGLLPIFKFLGRIPLDQNFDELTKTGIYFSFGEKFTGISAPVGISAYSCIILVMETAVGLYSHVIIEPSRGTVLIRRKNSNGWTEWIVNK